MAIFQNDENDSPNAPSDFSGRSSAADVPSSRSETIVGSSVSLEGDFESEENIVIHGSVRGTVTTKSDLTVGESASVHADVNAENVTVAGEVDGTVTATGKLRVTSTGKINGKITTRTLAVDEGAEITGEFSMGKAAESSEKVSEFVKKEKKSGAVSESRKDDKEEERSSDAEDAVKGLLPEMA